MGRGKLGDGDTMMSDPDYHQPVGIYGWRKRCLYSFILFLMIITVLNLALLVWILRVLNFSVDGMGKMRITDNGILLEGEAEFVKSLYTSKIASNQDKPLFVESSRGIIMHARDADGQITNTLAMANKTFEAECENFEVKNTKGETRFKVSDKEIEMKVDEVHFTGSSRVVFKGTVATPSLMGPTSDSLKIESLSTSLHLLGNAGVNINAPAGDINIKSSDDMSFKSLKSIYLNSSKVYLKNTRISSPQTGKPYVGTVYQLCMCPSGRLYLSPPDSNCQATKDVCQ